MRIVYTYGSRWSKSHTMKFCEAILEDEDGIEIGRGEYISTPEYFTKSGARKLAFSNLITNIPHNQRLEAWRAFAEHQRRN